MSTQFLKQEPKVNTRHKKTETREQRAAGEPLVQEVSRQAGELGEERDLSCHFVRVLPHLYFKVVEGNGSVEGKSTFTH